MTSTWMTLAPASSTSSTCSPRRAKSAERIEGATRRPAGHAARGHQSTLSIEVPQLLAAQVLVDAHPHDRLVGAAAGALRDELVALQAVDAAEPAGQLRRAQPRLAAARAGRPREGRGLGSAEELIRAIVVARAGLSAPDSRPSAATKNPSVRSRSVRVCRNRGSPAGAAEAEPPLGAEIVRPRRRRRRPRPRSRAARSCRSSRRAARPGPPPRGRVEDPLGRAGHRPIPSGLRRQRASGREASVPRPEQGGSTRTASKRPSSGGSVASADDHRRPGAEPARAAPELAGPARVALDGDEPGAPPPSAAAICVALMPGPAQRSRTRSPGCGASTSATSAEARDCGTTRPPATCSSTLPRSPPVTISESAGAGGGSDRRRVRLDAGRGERRERRVAIAARGGWRGRRARAAR